MLSGLTIRGRCLLAAGVAAALCALVLNERDLLRVAAFAVALPLLALCLANRAHVALAGHREIAPARISVGSVAAVRLHVHGPAAMPLGGLLLEDEVPRAVGNRPHFHLGPLPRRTETILEYPIRPRLRGVHQLGPLHTRIGDPFGLAEFERDLAERSRLIAIPQVVRLDALPAAGHGIGKAGATQLRAAHGDDDAMVRQYRHGDDIRRVHWKTTARQDELMVRVEERPWHGGVTVLLDRRSAAHRGSGARSSVEWAISAAASISLHLHQHGQQVRLVTEDGQPLAGGPGPADAGYDENTVLDTLAAVRPSTQRDLVCRRDPGDGQALIAVLGATTTAGVSELTKLRSQGMQSLALLLDVRAWGGTAEGGFAPEATVRRLRAAGWTVVVVEGPQESMASAWSRLCQESITAPGAGVSG